MAVCTCGSDLVMAGQHESGCAVLAAAHERVKKMSDLFCKNGIWMTPAAVENVNETSTDVLADLHLLQHDHITPEVLLEMCLNGADEDRRQGWRDYVQAITKAAEDGGANSYSQSEHSR